MVKFKLRNKKIVRNHLLGCLLPTVCTKFRDIWHVLVIRLLAGVLADINFSTMGSIHRKSGVSRKSGHTGI